MRVLVLRLSSVENFGRSSSSSCLFWLHRLGFLRDFCFHRFQRQASSHKDLSVFYPRFPVNAKANWSFVCPPFFSWFGSSANLFNLALVLAIPSHNTWQWYRSLSGWTQSSTAFGFWQTRCNLNQTAFSAPLKPRRLSPLKLNSYHTFTRQLIAVVGSFVGSRHRFLWSPRVQYWTLARHRQA